MTDHERRVLVCAKRHPMTTTTSGSVMVARCDVPRCDAWRIAPNGRDPVDGRGQADYHAQLVRLAQEDPALRADCVLLAAVGRAARRDPVAHAHLVAQARPAA